MVLPHLRHLLFLACQQLTQRDFRIMGNIEHSYRGLRLLFDLNWDRVLWPTAIAVGLMLGDLAIAL